MADIAPLLLNRAHCIQGRCALIGIVNMTEDSAIPVEKNFRSSYYKSLGFREEEKNLTQLEGIIKAEIIGGYIINSIRNILVVFW